MPCALDSGGEVSLTLGAVARFFTSFNLTAVSYEAANA
jgi:hypothetical protein